MHKKRAIIQKILENKISPGQLKLGFPQMKPDRQASELNPPVHSLFLAKPIQIPLLHLVTGAIKEIVGQYYTVKVQNMPLESQKHNKPESGSNMLACKADAKHNPAKPKGQKDHPLPPPIGNVDNTLVISGAEGAFSMLLS